ncbi:hypothetical protein HMPREF1980_01223 [Actinomyces sp. oral taxon 172 str. F0311]|nr:hypothetical protein HMPREF1980_01223 [Actinomyces sp. oral taxon 172 str. F0311]
MRDVHARASGGRTVTSSDAAPPPGHRCRPRGGRRWRRRYR